MWFVLLKKQTKVTRIKEFEQPLYGHCADPRTEHPNFLHPDIDNLVIVVKKASCTSFCRFHIVLFIVRRFIVHHFVGLHFRLYETENLRVVQSNENSWKVDITALADTSLDSGYLDPCK